MSSHDDVRDLFDFAAQAVLSGNPSARIVTSSSQGDAADVNLVDLGLDANPLEVGDGNETGGCVNGLTGMREAGDDHTIDGGSDPSLGDQRVVPATPMRSPPIAGRSPCRGPVDCSPARHHWRRAGR